MFNRDFLMPLTNPANGGLSCGTHRRARRALCEDAAPPETQRPDENKATAGLRRSRRRTNRRAPPDRTPPAAHRYTSGFAKPDTAPAEPASEVLRRGETSDRE